MIKHSVKTAFSSLPDVWSRLANFLLGGLQVVSRMKAVMQVEVLPAYRSCRFTDLLNSTRPTLVGVSIIDLLLLDLGVGDGGGGWVKSEGVWCCWLLF